MIKIHYYINIYVPTNFFFIQCPIGIGTNKYNILNGSVHFSATNPYTDKQHLLHPSFICWGLKLMIKSCEMFIHDLFTTQVKRQCLRNVII